MPAHYSTLKNQLASDIAEAMGFTASVPIVFGRPRKPIRTQSHAVVSTTVSRENVGRQVREKYDFSICLRVLETDLVSGQDPEDTLFAKAEALVLLLAPYGFDRAEIPPATEYAGLANMRYCSAVTPTDGQETDADKFHSVIVDFSCSAPSLYQ